MAVRPELEWVLKYVCDELKGPERAKFLMGSFWQTFVKPDPTVPSFMMTLFFPNENIEDLEISPKTNSEILHPHLTFNFNDSTMTCYTGVTHYWLCNSMRNKDCFWLGRAVLTDTLKDQIVAKLVKNRKPLKMKYDTFRHLLTKADSMPKDEIKRVFDNVRYSHNRW